MTGLFAQFQPAYAEHGITTIPCSTDDKQPLVKHWQRVGINGSRQLAVKFDQANAIGIVPGKRNGVTLLDVDSTDQRILEDAMERHSHSRLIVRTASGKFHAYYRHNGERRRIRPWPHLPIDIIGGGLAMAAPSLHASGRYEIIHGSLDALDNLTTLRNLEVEQTLPDQRNPITKGKRNNSLWRYCMGQAKHCDAFDDLLDVARTENSNFVPPLDDDEVIGVAKSAWAYTETGQNRFGEHGFFARTDLFNQFANDQDAFWLLGFLHGHNAPGRTFLCTNSLADIFHWRRQRLAAARTRLIDMGHIKQVRAAMTGRPALFEWRGWPRSRNDDDQAAPCRSQGQAGG